MNKEITVILSGREIRLYLHSNYISTGKELTPPHRHSRAEIHAIVHGEADFFIDGKHLQLCAGEFLMIPKDTFHYRSPLSEDSKIFTFEADLDATLSHYRISTQTLCELCASVEGYERSGKTAVMRAFLTLICSYFVDDFGGVNDVTDRKFLIDEFFTKNYNRDVTLSMLAKRLCLSEKQTERLVIKFTGNSFRKELARRRITAAIDLMESESITLTDVAEMVGYKTYSGFWKAYKAYIADK